MATPLLPIRQVIKMSNMLVEINESAAPKLKRGLARRLFSWGIDLGLIALAGVGCYFAIQSTLRKSEHEFHLNQLADRLQSNTSGAFEIVDPDRIYVKAIETGKPLEFAWRVYLPTGFKKIAVMEMINGKSGKSVITTLTQPFETIARFKIKLVGEYAVCEQHWLDEVSVFASELSDSKETQDFLEASDFNAAITQAGKVEVESFSKDDDLELLRLVVPSSRLTPRPNAKPGYSQFSFCLRDSIRSSQNRRLK